jgi:hypothetical protein
LVIRDISDPVLLRAKNPADWSTMCRNSWLRMSLTTRCPMSVIRNVAK